MPTPPELPQIAGIRAERIDAARKRAAIIEPAERMLRDQGADAITMDRLACEAGHRQRHPVSPLRRSREPLPRATRRIRAPPPGRIHRRPTPLRPDAPPTERLIAFGHALLSLTQERSDLLLAAQPPDPPLRYRSAVHTAYRAHITYLLRELEPPDPGYLADVLLAALAPSSCSTKSDAR